MLVHLYLKYLVLSPLIEDKPRSSCDHRCTPPSGCNDLCAAYHSNVSHTRIDPGHSPGWRNGESVQAPSTSTKHNMIPFRSSVNRRGIMPKRPTKDESDLSRRDRHRERVRDDDKSKRCDHTNREPQGGKSRSKSIDVTIRDAVIVGAESIDTGRSPERIRADVSGSETSSSQGSDWSGRGSTGSDGSGSESTGTNSSGFDSRGSDRLRSGSIESDLSKEELDSSPAQSSQYSESASERSLSGTGDCDSSPSTDNGGSDQSVSGTPRLTLAKRWEELFAFLSAQQAELEDQWQSQNELRHRQLKTIHKDLKCTLQNALHWVEEV